jgi:hypothetical protein
MKKDGVTGLDVFRLLVAFAAMVVMAAFGLPVLAVALLLERAQWSWRGLVKWLSTPPPWDAEGGSPELPWPPIERDHERRLREGYARRRAMPPWAGASSLEFTEARERDARRVGAGPC